MNIHDRVETWVSRQAGLQEEKERADAVDRAREESEKSARDKQFYDLEIKHFEDSFERVAALDQSSKDQAEAFGQVLVSPEGERWGTPRMISLKTDENGVSLTDVRETAEDGYQTTRYDLDNSTKRLQVQRQTIALSPYEEWVLVEEEQEFSLDTNSESLVGQVEESGGIYKRDMYYDHRES